MRYPMSGDEVWVAFISTALGGYLWFRWYWDTSKVWPTVRPLEGRTGLWLAPLGAALLLLTVLTTVASYDVVDDPRYIYMYFVFGMAWTGVATRFFPTAGLLVRDDAVERRNPAVTPALGGGILGATAAFAGGNIGDGPGWWVVLASAFVATLALFLLWHLLEGLTSVSDAITIERDEAAGWRLGGFLLSAGLILGRAVAGDWVSTEGMLADAVRVGWPAVLLLPIGVGFDKMYRPTETEPIPPVVGAGLYPALAMLLPAIAYLWWLGRPQ